MFKYQFLSAAFLLAASCSSVHAQVLLDLCSTSAGSFRDLGDMTSDGSGGRRAMIRPLERGEDGGRYEFFSNFLADADRFAEPPHSPPQSSIVLTEIGSLAITLPQLSHFPRAADVSVEHSSLGNDIEVNASIHLYAASTDWLAPPHEYVYELGAFSAGDYRLTLNLESSDCRNPNDPDVTTGFIDFTVIAVPEPSTASGFSMLAGIVIATIRGTHRSRYLEAGLETAGGVHHFRQFSL